MGDLAVWHHVILRPSGYIAEHHSQPHQLQICNPVPSSSAGPHLGLRSITPHLIWALQRLYQYHSSKSHDVNREFPDMIDDLVCRVSLLARQYELLHRDCFYVTPRDCDYGAQPQCGGPPSDYLWVILEIFIDLQYGIIYDI